MALILISLTCLILGCGKHTFMKYIVSAHTSFVKWSHNFREIIYFTFQFRNKITCLFYILAKYFCNKNQESFLCSLIHERKKYFWISTRRWEGSLFSHTTSTKWSDLGSNNFFTVTEECNDGICVQFPGIAEGTRTKDLNLNPAYGHNVECKLWLCMSSQNGRADPQEFMDL